MARIRQKRIPTETKVIAATGTGAVSGGGFGTFVLWLLGVYHWGASDDAGKASDAIAAVPWPVTVVVLASVAGAGTYVGGRLAPHTHREDLK